jgi:cytochrome P450/4-hydroxybenzoate polyprenyltransferase
LIATISRWLAPIRAGTWWEYKTPVLLGIAYATALAGGVPFSRLWPSLLACVAVIIPLASYVCVINDITDERDDLRAGKSNRMAGKPAAFKIAWLLACIAGGCLAGFACLRGNPVAAGVYAANWLAFTLYSASPVRLKTRGLAGVLADTAGGTLLPSLVAAVLVDPAASPSFIAAVAAWSGAFGLRGILYHQAGDIECDRRAGVGTLAVRLGPQRVASLVNVLLFPVEIAALGMIAWMAHLRYAVPLLLVYVAIQVAMRWCFQVHTVLVLPRERHRFAMLKYYQFWFPIAGLLELAADDSRAFAAIAAHLVLFPETWWRFPAHVADADILGRLGRLWRRLWQGRTDRGSDALAATSRPVAAATVSRNAPSCDLHWIGSRPDAHAHYAAARRLGPVCFDSKQNCWCVLGHQAAVECLSTPHRFRGDPFSTFDPVNLAGDMPQQAWFRRVLQKSLHEFDRSTVESLTIAWMDRFLGRMTPDAEFDAVADFAVPLIDDLAGHMIGLRPDEVAMLASSRPTNRTDVHGNDTEAWHFFATRLIDQSAVPRTGALRVILEHVRSGNASEHQAVGLARVLWIGATATTNLLVASAMMRLVRHPEMQSFLRKQPALVPKFVGEVLRIDSPVAVITRCVAEDGDFFGQYLRAEDVVKVCLLAANSDPAEFPDPDRIDLDRPPGRHIAFGFGPHICLGAAIARTLAETAVGEVVRCLPSLQPAEDLDGLEYEIGDMRGLKRLRLRVS